MQELRKFVVEAEAVVAVQNPLKAERVQILLRNLDEARLDLNELRLTAELIKNLLELGQVLACVADVEFAERLDVLDRRTLRPRDAHLLEERLPVLTLALFLAAR